MNVSEIISDALVYPFNNIKALLIYIILGIIAGVLMGGTIFAVFAGQATNNALLAGGVGIIGLIVSIIVVLLISGFELDIIKYGIKRDSGAPGIDVTRQIVNAIKLIVVRFIYYLIPIIIVAILGAIFRNWLMMIITAILIIIFSLAEFMGECRLAKDDSLGSALSIGEAIGDISRVGIGKLIATLVVAFIVLVILFAIIGAIANFNAIVGGILLGICGVYLTFFLARIKGLLYSDV